MIKMILAIDQGGALGWSDGQLAYRDLKIDMARFKALTTNSKVVMGRSTYLSLGRPNGLPNRQNFVLTRQPYSAIRGQIIGDIPIISSLDYVVQMDKNSAVDTWIIGGGSVYDEALEKGIVDEIHLTIIHATCEADVRLKTDLVAWKLFVIRQRAQGIFWEVDLGDTIWDGDFQTTYIVLRKVS